MKLAKVKCSVALDFLSKVDEKAALALAECDKAEFLSRLADGDLAWGPANVKLVETVSKDGRRFWVVGAAQAWKG